MGDEKWQQLTPEQLLRAREKQLEYDRLAEQRRHAEAAAAYIGWDYPVNGSIFDLAQEAPITFTKQDGTTVTIGIPWHDVGLTEP